MKITPFLDSANRVIEYTTVAAAADILPYVNHARTDSSEVTKGIVRREVHGLNGKLTFFSRCRPAGDQYRDEQGRLILRIDGICVADDPEGRFVFHPHYLDKATQINDGHFEKFWTRTDFREGAVRVSDEIAPLPERELPPLREPIEPITVLEPYEAPKKNRGDTAKPKPRIDAAAPVDPVLAPGKASATATDSVEGTRESHRDSDGSGRQSRETIQESSEVAAERQAVKRRIGFNAVSVGLGAIGLGLIAHGLLRFLVPHQPGTSGKEEADRAPDRQPLLRLAEVGAGSGLTWAAYVQAQRDLGASRIL